MERLFVTTLTNFYGYNEPKRSAQTQSVSKTRLQATLEKLAKLSNPQKVTRSVNDGRHSHRKNEKIV